MQFQLKKILSVVKTRRWILFHNVVEIKPRRYLSRALTLIIADEPYTIGVNSEGTSIFKTSNMNA